jgi:hypothetical protein
VELVEPTFIGSLEQVEGLAVGTDPSLAAFAASGFPADAVVATEHEDLGIMSAFEMSFNGRCSGLVSTTKVATRAVVKRKTRTSEPLRATCSVQLASSQ